MDDKRDSFHDRVRQGEQPFSIDETEGKHCVVACPPHPLHGGNRNDRRLIDVCKELKERGISCLRFDYGDWDDSEGETQDVIEAVEFAQARWERIGLFGYSFGAFVSSKAVKEIKTGVECLGLLAPPGRASDFLEGVEIPVYVLAGERDSTVDSSRVVETVERSELLPADHFFVGQGPKVARRFGDFFEKCLKQGEKHKG
ncbi:MAG: alpha/beta hydrolase [Halobacteria archaeon]|nr:alpha/beta hydrolase [Halobacteria archaeon]